jgi:hypothetical protein
MSLVKFKAAFTRLFARVSKGRGCARRRFMQVEYWKSQLAPNFNPWNFAWLVCARIPRTSLARANLHRVNTAQQWILTVLQWFIFTTLTTLLPANRINSAYLLIKAKKQSSPATRHGGAWGEKSYSSYSLLTSVLDGGEWSASCPGRPLPRGKDPRYPLYRRLGGPQGRSGHRG